MLFKSTVATCLSVLSYLDVASAAVIEPRACAAGNLLRAFRDKRYAAAAAEWCIAYNNVPVVTTTVDADVKTVTELLPNPSTTRLTETSTVFTTWTTQTRATETKSGATTMPSVTWVEVRLTSSRVWNTYTSTTTTTTTLRKTSEVAIPTALGNIVTKYAASSVSSACSCLDVTPSTTTETIGAATVTVASLAPVKTIVFHPKITSSVTETVTMYPYESTVRTPVTSTETGFSFTATTWASEVYTETRTACAYEQSPVMNPSFEDGDAGWRKMQFADYATTVALDNTTSHNEDGSNAWKIEFRSIGSILGVYQVIEDMCPTTWYTMSMWVYAAQPSDCRPRFSSGHGYAAGDTLQPGWNKYSVNVYTWAAGLEMSSMFYIDCGYTGGTRTFWMDDLDVQRMDPQPPVPARQ